MIAFVAARVFDDGAKAQALAHCRAMQADMGGTEILQSLRDISNNKAPKEAPRQVFVITDGQVRRGSDMKM